MTELLQWPATVSATDVERLRELAEDVVEQLVDHSKPLSIRGALLAAARRGYCLGHLRAKELSGG